jgi:hypothetical protein
MWPLPLSRLLLAALVCWSTLASAPAAAQYREGDDRDRVHFLDGEQLAGRLLWRHDPDGKLHWLLPTGRVRRYHASEVAKLDLVSDRLAAWLQARRPSASLDEEWALVEYARDAGLEAMARAQAYHLLTRSPDDERAHRFLGHELRGGRWLWKFAGQRRAMSFEDWDARGRDRGHPLELRGEHFLLRTTAGLERGVDLLFDLERAYGAFQREFAGGARLAPWECVRRVMHVWVHADAQGFPALSSARRGYYLPGLTLAPSDAAFGSGAGNEVVTYFTGSGAHPADFFELVGQQLLYNCVLGERTNSWDGARFGLYRDAASLEVGFGHWFGSRLRGRPGFVELAPFQFDPADARIAETLGDSNLLGSPRKQLSNLVGLNYEVFHRNDQAEREDFAARARALFAYLADPGNLIPAGRRAGTQTRSALFEYMREVYLTNTGASTSKLDDALGTRIERLEPAFRAWLAQH